MKKKAEHNNLYRTIGVHFISGRYKVSCAQTADFFHESIYAKSINLVGILWDRWQMLLYFITVICLRPNITAHC